MPIPRFLNIVTSQSDINSSNNVTSQSDIRSININSKNMAYKRANGKSTEDVLDEFHKYQMEDYDPTETEDEDMGDFKGGDYQQYAEGVLMQRLLAKEGKGNKNKNNASLQYDQTKFLILIAILFFLLCCFIGGLVLVFRK
jgi:hypothetical protein